MSHLDAFDAILANWQRTFGVGDLNARVRAAVAAGHTYREADQRVALEDYATAMLNEDHKRNRDVRDWIGEHADEFCAAMRIAKTGDTESAGRYLQALCSDWQDYVTDSGLYDEEAR